MTHGPPAHPALVFEGVVHGYAKGAPVLDGLGFSLNGGICGVLGRNGAGKSTLLRLAAALLPPNRGTVRVDGLDTRKDPEAAKTRTAYLPEALHLDGRLTPAEFLEFVGEIRGCPDRAAGLELLERLGGAEVADRLYRELSFGMRRKTGLAAAFLAETRLVVLDEPETGLDVAGLDALEGLIVERARRGTTVLLSSHDTGFISRICEQLLVIRRGAPPWQGTPEQLQGEADGDLHRALLHVSAAAS